MELKAALKVAAKFAAKAQEPSGSTCVRFLPGGQGMRSMLCAQDERCGVCCYVDDEIPNTMVDAVLLSKVAREAKHAVDVETAGYGGVNIRTGQTTYFVKPEDMLPLDSFPAVPVIPQSFELMDRRPIEQVVHAASKEDKELALRTVHFTASYVEATDKYRLARVALRGGWTGLLPVEVFQNMPKGIDLGACFTQRMAYFNLGEQVRFAQYVGLTYPDCKNMIPEKHEGAEMVVGVESLLRAVKQATSVSATKNVELRFRRNQIIVSVWKQEDDPERFEAIVQAKSLGMVEGPTHVTNVDGSVLISGKSLVETLKVLQTPMARVRYNRVIDPLRIESGGYIECLWPMLA